MDNSASSIVDGMLAKLAANDASLAIKIKQEYEKACTLNTAIDKKIQEIELLKRDSDKFQELAGQKKQEIERMNHTIIHAKIMHNQCLESVKSFHKQLEAMNLDATKRNKKRKDVMLRYEQIMQKQKVLYNLHPLVQTKANVESELLQATVYVNTLKLRLSNIQRAQNQFEDIQSMRLNGAIVEFIRWIKKINELREIKRELIGGHHKKAQILDHLRAQYESKLKKLSGTSLQSRLASLTQKYGSSSSVHSFVTENTSAGEQNVSQSRFNELFKNLQQRSLTKKSYEPFVLPSLLSWDFSSTICSSNESSKNELDNNCDLAAKRVSCGNIDQNIRSASISSSQKDASASSQETHIMTLSEPMVGSAKGNEGEGFRESPTDQFSMSISEPQKSLQLDSQPSEMSLMDFDSANSRGADPTLSVDESVQSVDNQHVNNITGQRHQLSALHSQERTDDDNLFPDMEQNVTQQPNRYFSRAMKVKGANRFNVIEAQKLCLRNKVSDESFFSFNSGKNDRREKAKRPVKRNHVGSIEYSKAEFNDIDINQKRETGNKFNKDSKSSEHSSEESVQINRSLETDHVAIEKNINDAPEPKQQNKSEKVESDVTSGKYSHYFTKGEISSNFKLNDSQNTSLSKQFKQQLYDDNVTLDSTEQQYMKSDFSFHSGSSSPDSYLSPKNVDVAFGGNVDAQNSSVFSAFEFPSTVDQIFNTNDVAKDDDGFSFNFGSSVSTNNGGGFQFFF